MSTLKDLRGERDQEQIAKAAGISASYLSLIESGKRRISLELATSLANAYGVSINKVIAAYNHCRTSSETEIKEASDHA